MNTVSAADSASAGSAENLLRRQKAFDLCVRKTRSNIKRLADEPKSAAWAEDGNFFEFKEGFFDIGNWTSSFFTGMALIAWEEAEDEYFLNQVLRLAPFYTEKVFAQHRNTHHDLGFLYSLFSVAIYKLTRDVAHRQTALRAAALLAARFNEKGNFIRAWGHMDTSEHDNLAIIDSLMNLPLLFWAARETGQKRYLDIAIRHANTVLKYFVRPDYSVCHAYRFDLKTGKPIGPEDFSGRGPDCYWARGAAWAIYGFALSYGYTGNEEYRRAAVNLAKAFIAQLDSEIVPLWEFRLPPNVPRIRDSSAAAIAVCGFQELAKHDITEPALALAKEALLSRLCVGDYLNSDEDCPGILKNAYGEKRAYSSWGDYFLMEALARDLFAFESYW
jgi:unsaturated chondroitin disaccharide hydrolase